MGSDGGHFRMGAHADCGADGVMLLNSVMSGRVVINHSDNLIEVGYCHDHCSHSHGFGGIL